MAKMPERIHIELDVAQLSDLLDRVQALEERLKTLERTQNPMPWKIGDRPTIPDPYVPVRPYPKIPNQYPVKWSFPYVGDYPPRNPYVYLFITSGDIPGTVGTGSVSSGGR